MKVIGTSVIQTEPVIQTGLVIQSGLVIDPFRPTDIADARLWYDASDTSTITHSGGAVSSVTNKVTGGNPAYQTLAASKPTTGATTINGRNALSFDGGDALIIDDFTYSVLGQTIFIVAQTSLTTEQWILAHYDTGGNQRAWGVFASNSSNLLVHSVSPDGTAASLRNVTTTNTIGTNPKLLTTRWVANDTDLYLNGVAETTGGTPASSMLAATPKLTIGARYISGALATFLTGKIGEIIMYDRALTEIERGKVSSYLLAKWGLP